MKQFVPFDDAWFDHPDAMPSRLVPYQCGLPCRHQRRKPSPRQNQRVLQPRRAAPRDTTVPGARGGSWSA